MEKICVHYGQKTRRVPDHSSALLAARLKAKLFCVSDNRPGAEGAFIMYYL
jgi:hypothetical protein